MGGAYPGIHLFESDQVHAQAPDRSDFDIAQN